MEAVAYLCKRSASTGFSELTEDLLTDWKATIGIATCVSM